jgi:hypothetical protein
MKTSRLADIHAGESCPGRGVCVDIIFQCHQISVVAVADDLGRPKHAVFNVFWAPLDLARQIVDGLRVLYFRSDCREHTF